MSWARLDDLFDDNRKVKRTFRRCPTAIAVYVMAITYCARHATDGVVDIDWLEERLPAPEARADVLAALTAGGLFEHLPAGDTRTVEVEARTKHAGAHSVQLGPLPEDAYLVHDFLDYNPSSVEVEARRAADAQRKRQTREERPRGRRADAARTPRAVHAESESPGPARPGPTRPDPRSSSPDVGSRVPAPAAAPARTVPPSPSEDERQRLAEQIRGLLQNGIDGLTSDDSLKRPTREAILATLAEHEPDPKLAMRVAIEVRSIAQSQDRAPNIAALYAKKLAEHRNGHHTRPTP